jgi:hypothetical protein
VPYAQGKLPPNCRGKEREPRTKWRHFNSSEVPIILFWVVLFMEILIMINFGHIAYTKEWRISESNCSMYLSNFPLVKIVRIVILLKVFYYLCCLPDFRKPSLLYTTGGNSFLYCRRGKQA